MMTDLFLFEKYRSAPSRDERCQACCLLHLEMMGHEEPVEWLLSSFEELTGGTIDDHLIRRLIQDFDLKGRNDAAYWKWRKGYTRRRMKESLEQLRK